MDFSYTVSEFLTALGTTSMRIELQSVYKSAVSQH